SSGEASLEQRLASSGAYTLVVQASSGTGPYTVTWWLDRLGALVNGGTVNATLGDVGQKDRYRVDAQQGQLLQAQVKRTSGITLQPYLELIDPSGAREATGAARSSGEASLEQRLASSGAYTLVVQASSGTGPYSVTLTLR